LFRFLASHAALAGQLTHLARTLSSAKTQLLLSSDLLQHLESKNVYNDAFQIGHAPLLDPGATTTAAPPSAAVKSSVTVGTINGLRLGGRPTVDWDEINAAWGLVALCIDRLAAKVGCTFDQWVNYAQEQRVDAKRYKIVPLGSFSRIEEVGKGLYELYASSDMTPVRILQNRRFSQGLVALLDCLRQLVDYGRNSNRSWGQTGIEYVRPAQQTCPCTVLQTFSPADFVSRISKDKINGHSIRLPGITSGIALGSMSLMGLGAAEPDPKAPQGNPDEQWTRACRSVLGVLKRILVVESEADRGT
jgi:beclin 1